MIDTAIYKERLENELDEITTGLQALGIHNPQVKEDWIALPEDGEITEPDENVAADRAEDLEERIATLASLETRYNNIVRALAKIEAGTYGVCEISGKEIEEDRLIANPAARTCKAHLNDEQDLSE